MQRIKEQEEQINKLIKENSQYKSNLEKLEKTQIAEYQKLLDDSFNKIAQLSKELNDSKDKNKYLEKTLNIIEKTANKNNSNFSPYISKENTSLDLNEQNMNLNNNNINIKKNNMKKNKKIKNLSSNGRKELSNENNKDFLSKKRKIPKIYQCRCLLCE